MTITIEERLGLKGKGFIEVMIRCGYFQTVFPGRQHTVDDTVSIVYGKSDEEYLVTTLMVQGFTEVE